MITDHLFVYGTLIAGSGNAVERAAHATLGPGVAGVVQGVLYAIPDTGGWYPALLPGEGVVHGVMHPVLPGLDLRMLDAYEGADYQRRVVSVETASGPVMAQAYLWAMGLPDGAARIEEGNFLAHARARHWRLFGA